MSMRVRQLSLLSAILLTCWVLSLTLWSVAKAAEEGPLDLSTRSFTNTSEGSDPQTLTITMDSADTGMITVDLSALMGAEVYRATLDPYANPKPSIDPYDIRSADGETLELRGPRFLTFDATDAIIAALANAANGDSPILTLQIKNSGQGFGTMTSLDIMSNTPAPNPIPQVTDTSARFADGDTMITFAEVNPPFLGGMWSTGQYKAAMRSYANDVYPKFRYRIYRSATPLTSSHTLASAELVDEITPLSGWNGSIAGYDPHNPSLRAGQLRQSAQALLSFYPLAGNKDDIAVPPLPTDDFTWATAGTGIYVNRYTGNQSSEEAYYFVSHVVNGAEDFSFLNEGSNATAAVTESAGSGMVLRWTSDRIEGQWVYSPNMNMRLDYYVRWESPPHWNVPSQPFNYRVGVPLGSEKVDNPPLTVDLHAWSEHFDLWSPWPRYEDGAILLTSNLQVYNAYTAFHENLNTLKPWNEGSAQPYFQARLLSFMYDFLYEEHNIDQERVALYGESMGGAGTHMLGMRSGHIFSHLLAGVGHNLPAEDPQWLWSFENRGGYGQLGWQIPYSNPQLARFGYPQIAPEDDYSVWDYFNNRDWLEANPRTETPYISFSNSPIDQAIGWDQAWEVARTVVSTNRGFNFSWGQRGHGQPIEPLAIDFTLHQSIPAFTNGSLDDDLGDSPDAAELEGQCNRYLRWDVTTITDEPTLWEMDLFLDAAAPASSATVDVTPRRLQAFVTTPLAHYAYELISENNSVVADGVVSADNNGIITIPQLQLTTAHSRLILMPLIPLGETPTATPVTPTAVTPTATPVTPTATPITPTATPVTPTATPEPPTATPTAATPTPVPEGTGYPPPATPTPEVTVPPSRLLDKHIYLPVLSSP